jgi:CRISPR-associated endonuclease/helicase Cas3
MNTTNSLQQLYYRYWAKSTNDKDILNYHLLPYHLLDVAAVGYILLEQDTRLRKRLADLCGMSEEALHLWLTFMLALHDVGKFSQQFQQMRDDIVTDCFHQNSLRSISPQKIHHTTLGYTLWKFYHQTWFDALKDYPCAMLWKQIEQCYSETNTPNFWLHAIMGHHGKPIELGQANSIRGKQRSDCFSEQNVKAASAFVIEMSEVFADLFNERFDANQLFVKTPLSPAASWVVAGFAVICDWLGSDKRYFPYKSDEISLAEYWKNYANPYAQKAISQSGVIPAKPGRLKTTAKWFGFPPSPLQEYAESISPLVHEPVLYIVEDLTGSGKTETALQLAHRIITAGNADGIMVALPTMATSDAMYERLAGQYQELFDKDTAPSLALTHSAAKFHEGFRETLVPPEHWKDDSYAQKTQENGESSISAVCNRWFADYRKKSVLADVGVGTIDQILLSVLHSSHQSLRLFGLSRKVIIADEIHANDTYMHKLLCEVLRFHAAFGGSAVLLSATLPIGMKRELSQAFIEGARGIESGKYAFSDADNTGLSHTDYPLFTSVHSCSTHESIDAKPFSASDSLRRTVQREFLRSEEEALRRVVEASKSSCVLWIRNTVSDALSVYTALQEHIADSHLTLFHARFALQDRLAIGKKVLKLAGKQSIGKERLGQVVIATQVAEQSLDVDFDCVITDLAPMDVLLQRMGRLCRHKRNAEGITYPQNTGDDHRNAVLYILAPPLTEPIAENWYSAMFPNGRYVYQDHALLWRTARELEHRTHLSMPDDARTLINAVFDSQEEPEALVKHSNAVFMESGIQKQQARQNIVKLHDGYQRTTQSWTEGDDMRITPTRMGEESTTVRLAQWSSDHTALIPWAKHNDLGIAWRLSEVSVRRRVIADEYHDKIPKSILEAAFETMPDKGANAVVIVISPNLGDTKNSDTLLLGNAVNLAGQTVIVEYTPLRGLAWKKAQ